MTIGPSGRCIDYVTPRSAGTARSRARSRTPQVLDTVVLRRGRAAARRSRSSSCASTPGTHDIYQLLAPHGVERRHRRRSQDARRSRARLVARDARRRARSRASEGARRVRRRSRASPAARPPSSRGRARRSASSSRTRRSCSTTRSSSRSSAGSSRASTRSSRCSASSPRTASRTSPRSAAGTATAAGRSTRRSGSCSASSPAASTAGSSRSTRSRGAPRALLDRLRRLGEVTAHMHTVLASDSDDPAFAPEEPSVESLGAAHRDDRRGDRAGLPRRCPTTTSALAPIAGRGEEVREQLRLLSHVGVERPRDPHPRRLPPRPDPLDRRATGSSSTSRASRRGRSPSAGASARRCATSPGCCARSPTRRSAAELAARRAPRRTAGRSRRASAFLDGYLADGRPDAAARPGGARSQRLLAVFELEKAVYELRYELDNRPDWVGIPVAGIDAAACDEAADGAVSGDLGARIPHRVLGAHAADGGVVVRALRPDARAVGVRPRDDGDGAGRDSRRPTRAACGRRCCRGRGCRSRYGLEVAYPDGERVHGCATRTRSCRRSASSTCTSRARAATSSSTSGSARTRARSTASPARPSPSGRRTRARSSVVGDFNGWDGRLHPMRSLGASGIWELFVPGVGDGHALQVRDPRRRTGELRLKADPLAFAGRGAAGERVGRLPVQPRLAGRRPGSSAARPRDPLARPDLDLRGAPRLVAAQPARGQPPADVPRARRRARRLRRATSASPTSS